MTKPTWLISQVSAHAHAVMAGRLGGVGEVLAPLSAGERSVLTGLLTRVLQGRRVENQSDPRA